MYDEVPVMIDPQPDSPIAESFPHHDIAAIRLLTASTTFDAAVASAFAIVEPVVDALAFQMQVALHVVSFDLIDATGPFVVDAERTCEVHANADAMLAPKFSGPPPDFAWTEHVVEIPSLDINRFPPTIKCRMALWWYVKALDVPYAVDKFMCLWTATEILWEGSDVKITESYTARCGHAIESCPECGESVSRLVRGASIKRYLVERGEVSDEDASGLWGIRQVIHGRNVFSPGRIEELGRLVTVLRAAVLRLLKEDMRYPPDERPVLIRADGPILGQTMVLRGSRVVDDEDVDSVVFLDGLVADGR